MKRAFLLALFAVALSAQYTPPAGGGGGFPTVVASVVDTGVTTSKTYNNLASAPTDDGLYVLAPYWIATTQDAATNYDFSVNWTDQNGPQTFDMFAGPAQYTVPINSFGSIAVIHPAIGTSIQGVWTVTGTGIQTMVPSAGNAGSGYAPGDTGDLTSGGGSAGGSYTVLTVDGGGGVLTLSVLHKGKGYSISTNHATTPGPPMGGGDGTLQVDVTALAPPAAVFAYYATLERLH